MSEFLAYRIPDQAIKKMSGQFELIDQENMPKNCFILSNFNQNKQYVFIPNEQVFEETFEAHFNSEEPKVISKETYISEGERIVEFLKNKSMNKFVFSRIKKTDFDASKCIKLFDALSESYPKLKANKEYMKLQTHLVDTENRIALARNYYNQMATFYNDRQQVIPDRWVAKMTGKKPFDLLTVNEPEPEFSIADEPIG